MAVSVKDVERLNEKIEGLNTDRTKTETRKEVLTQNLEKELKAYAEAYGVDLKGKKFSETFKNIQREAQKVSQQIEEEFELKSKVVSAIESGDIAEANKLLGIEEVDDSEEEEEFTSIDEDQTSFEEEVTDTAKEPSIPTGMSPIEETVQDLEDEGGSVIGKGLNLGKDFLVEDDEEDEDDEFSMSDFLGEQFN